MAIVGIAIVALLEFMASGTQAHSAVQRMLQATEYASTALDYVANLTDAQRASLEGRSEDFSPPINGQGVRYTEAVGWRQVITAQTVSETALKVPASPGSTKALWVTVAIERNGRPVHAEKRLFMSDL